MKLQTNHLAVVTAAFLFMFSIGCGESGQSTAQDADQSASIKSEESVDTATLMKKLETAEEVSENEIMLLVKELVQLRWRGKFAEANKIGTFIRSKGWDAGKYNFLLAEVAFADADPAGAVESFENVLTGRPESKPQLWQRGIALYYNNQFEDGVDQFNTHQTYNKQDVENSVWQLLCRAKTTSVEEARSQMIEIKQDGRVGMKEIFDMFAGTKTPEEVLEACGHDPNEAIPKNGTLYHGFLYIGLYHEMMGETEKSAEAIAQALQAQPTSDQLMFWIARVHQQLRSQEQAANEDKPSVEEAKDKNDKEKNPSSESSDKK